MVNPKAVIESMMEAVRPLTDRLMEQCPGAALGPPSTNWSAAQVSLPD